MTTGTQHVDGGAGWSEGDVTVDDGGNDAPRWRRPMLAAGRISLWIALTVLLTLDHRDDLGSYIPGDTGDAYLVLSLLEWGGDRAADLFAGFWAGPMFAGTPDAMAYSDTFLALVIPFKIIETLTGSEVIAFNVLYIAGWVLCAEATYALARRLLGNAWIAWVAAAAFTFSTIRVTGSNHFQLMWAGLIPLSFLALYRFWEAPSFRRAIALGAAVLAQMLTSAYYGVMVLVVVGTMMAVWTVRELIRDRDVARLLSAVAFFALVGLPMLYLQHQYSTAAETSAGRPDYPGYYATRLGDLRSPSPSTHFLHAVPFLDSESSLRSPENHAYIGVFVVVGIGILLVFLALRPSDVARRVRFSAVEWLTVVGAGVLGFAIAYGRNEFLGIQSPFYDIARYLIPGISKMFAIGRLVVFTQLALVLLAGLAVACLVELLERRKVLPTVVLPIVSVSLVVLVAFESAMQHPMIYVVEPQPGSVNEYLETQGSGSVALLPMAPISAGILQPLTEGPRMVLGSDDELRSVNGYSGDAPRDYESTVATLNEFPSAEALELVDRLDLRFVVIYTAGVEIPDSALDDAVNGSGFAFWPRAEANRRIDLLPPGVIIDRFDGVDGIVLEFDPSMSARG